MYIRQVQHYLDNPPCSIMIYTLSVGHGDAGSIEIILSLALVLEERLLVRF